MPKRRPFLEFFKLFLKNLLAFNFSIKCFSKSLLLFISHLNILSLKQGENNSFYLPYMTMKAKL